MEVKTFTLTVTANQFAQTMIALSNRKMALAIMKEVTEPDPAEAAVIDEVIEDVEKMMEALLEAVGLDHEQFKNETEAMADAAVARAEGRVQ